MCRRFIVYTKLVRGRQPEIENWRRRSTHCHYIGSLYCHCARQKNEYLKFEFIWLTCWVDENCGRKEERWIVRLLPTLLDNRLKVSFSTWPFLSLFPLLGVGSHARVADTEEMSAHACRTLYFSYIYHSYQSQYGNNLEFSNITGHSSYYSFSPFIP